MHQQRSETAWSRLRRHRWTLGALIALSAAALTTVIVCFALGVFSSVEPAPGTEVELAESGELPANLGPAWEELDDPANDGWESEVFSDAAVKRLKALAKLLAKPESLTGEQLDPYLTARFSCGPLLPAKLTDIYQDQTFQVRRATARPSVPQEGRFDSYRGSAGLIEALHELKVALGAVSEPRWFFKMFRVTRDGDAILTRQYVACSGRTTQGMVEQNATWVIRWREDDRESPPRIDWIGVEDFEQVVSRHPEGRLFADCTRSLLERCAIYEPQFLRGMNHWLKSIQDTRYFYLFGNPALALGDVNGDGLEDLYVGQEESLPNRLFLQRADGSVREVAAEWGVDWLHSSRGVLLVDLDNDGDQDLVVATVGHVLLAANEGNRFALRAILPTDDDTMSLCSADYDLDGDLDLYVCVYFRRTDLEAAGRGTVLGGVVEGVTQSELAGGRNALFRNDTTDPAHWEFTDVTNSVGLGVQNQRVSLAAAWEDYDNDGDPDLYVANDYGRNNLYRNEGDRFTDVAEETGAEDVGFGMAVTWADYDQDGWMDLYVANMFSAAGNRVMFQEDKGPTSSNLRQRYQRFARGNTLLKNNPDGTFSDVSVDQDVTIGRWAWGSIFSDLNNDSREDLIVVNGFVTTDDTGDL